MKISSATTGYVTRVLLNETDSARSGEPVVEIDGEAYSAGGTGVKGGVSLALEAQRRALHAEMLVSRDAYTRNIESIKIQIPLLESQLADAVDELNIYQQEQVDQQLLLDKIEPLLKSGYIAATQVQQQRSSLASVKANVRSQRSKISSIRLDLEGRRADLARAPLDLASQINTSERLLASADVEAQSNAGDLSSALLSPVNGIVSSVLVSEGQAVKPGQILMTIIKDTSKTEAQLLVDSQSIGFIEIGTKVALRLRAYPFQKFGVLMGTVKAKSLTTLSPSEAADRFGMASVTESMFLVRVELERQSLDVYGNSVRLTPGMYVDADVMLDRRRLYEWLFQPAYTLRMKTNE
ncbi:HlyD family efflux transporter periplasmic adaptor subunit [Xanthomonas arboricola]|uniref:HlyD family secretion protein n=1 Tax=Xanthomonas arboricola TaxID=56448 RepID=UPI002B296495|nr:HlyD family efflux transporter periplasmic adaptor subunit [Xanthomonas arboricola]